MRRLYKSPIFWIIASLLPIFLGYYYKKPILIDFLSQQTRQYFAEKSFPLNIKFDRIKISLLPLRITITDLEIRPKRPLSSEAEKKKSMGHGFARSSKKTRSSLKKGKVNIDELVATPSIFDLIFGKIALKKVSINNSFYELTLFPNDQEKEMPPFQLSTLLSQIPIETIAIKNTSGVITYKDQTVIRQENASVQLRNNQHSVIAKIAIEKLRADRKKTPAQTTDFSLETQLTLTDSEFLLSSLLVTNNKNYLVASGKMKLEDQYKSILHSDLAARTHLNLGSLPQWIQPWLKKENNLPKLGGTLSGDIKLQKADQTPLLLLTDIKADAISIDHILIGNLHIHGPLRAEEKLTLPGVDLELPGENNKIGIPELVVRQKNGILYLKNKVILHQLNLKSFLKASQLSKANVDLSATGGFTCEGTVTPELKLTCPGSLNLSNFDIRSPSGAPIIATSSMKVEGVTHWTQDKFDFDTELQTAKSKGSASGTIDFSKGFSTKYSAERFTFADFGPIGNLDLEGTAKLQGRANGDSRSGQFHINIESSDTFLSSYKLGNLQTSLFYENGRIHLKDIKGALNSTRYSGKVDVDLIKEKLQGKIALPFLRMLDVQESVARKVDLKERLTGSGSGVLSLDSNFDIERLNFQLKANLFEGLALGESYDKLDISLIGTEGIVHLKSFHFKKKAAKAHVEGFVTMDLDSALRISIRNGNLRESSNVTKLRIPVDGLINGQGSVRGSLANPDIEVQVASSNIKFNNYVFGDVQLQYKDKGEQSILSIAQPGVGQFQLINADTQPDQTQFKFDSHGMNVAPLLTYVSGQESDKNYLFTVHGTAQGIVNWKNWWNSVIDYEFSGINLKYKEHRLTSDEPFTGFIRNGLFKTDTLTLAGNRQSLTLKNTAHTKFSSRFSIDGEMNISLFKVFAPFLKRIEGQSTIHMELNVSRNNLKLIGSSYTRDGYLQFPGFPHPIENFTADLLYNQNSIVINSMGGRIGGGQIQGQGQVKLGQKGGIAVDINTQFEDVSINFPEDIRSTGSGSLKLKGRKFPYTLSGVYTIESGLIEMEAEGEESAETSNEILAELLNENLVSPIDLNIEINANRGIEINNSISQGEVEGQLTVRGNLDQPLTKGSLAFKQNSILLFKDTEFFITDSNFSFREQWPVNPTLFLTAETRVQNYDIKLLLQGVGQNPKLQLSSQPSLTNRQLISLLTLGQISRDLEGEQSSFAIDDTAQNNQGLQIGTNLFKDSAIGKELKKFKGWDIQFATSLEEGTNYAVPQILVTKKISKKAKAQLNRQQARQSQTELNLQYKIKDNLSGIFRLRRLENTDNTDQNLTLPQADTQFGLDLEYKREFD